MFSSPTNVTYGPVKIVYPQKTYYQVLSYGSLKYYMDTLKFRNLNKSGTAPNGTKYRTTLLHPDAKETEQKVRIKIILSDGSTTYKLLSKSEIADYVKRGYGWNSTSGILTHPDAKSPPDKKPPIDRPKRPPGGGPPGKSNLINVTIIWKNGTNSVYDLTQEAIDGYKAKGYKWNAAKKTLTHPEYKEDTSGGSSGTGKSWLDQIKDWFASLGSGLNFDFLGDLGEYGKYIIIAVAVIVLILLIK